MATSTNFKQHVNWLSKKMDAINAYCAKNNLSIMFDYYNSNLAVYNAPDITSGKYREADEFTPMSDDVESENLPMCFEEYDNDYPLGTLKSNN